MSALETLERIAANPHLATLDLRYCLVAEDKVPHTWKGSRARPNAREDFCSLEELCLSEKLDLFAGVGISVVDSKVCAIDVDKCFSIPFSEASGDDRAKDIISMFEGEAYIEFSFSGKGLRILFFAKDIPDYSEKYYIKNDRNKIEYYQPGNTARYVTLTGMAIRDNALDAMSDESVLLAFLDKYMARPKNTLKRALTHEIEGNDERSLDELLRRVKSLYLRDMEFQELWFGEAPGSGKNESQMDYHLALILAREITTDKEKLRELFESSPYFKSKDAKHMTKWFYNDYRYWDYIYDHI